MVVIKVEFGRTALTASGVSEAFLNEIRALADARCWSGTADFPRFSERTVKYLEDIFKARGADLRDAVFQLSHLLALATKLSPRGRALDVLYGYDGPVRAKRLSAYLADLSEGNDHVAAEPDGFTLTYAGGETYRLASARLPLLMALMEFSLAGACEAEGGPWMPKTIAEIEAAPESFDHVRRTSNTMASRLSAYLDQALRSRVDRERFESLASFLDARATQGGAGDNSGKWVIDDAAVLEFWRDAVADPEKGGDFRQYRTVHRAFVALVLALREGEDWARLYRARSTDASEDAFLQIEATQGGFETLEEGGNTPLDQLTEPPIARVKFLTGAEEKALEIAVRLWGAVRMFPLSVLRSEVMGGVQNEIINALRFRRPVAPLLNLEKLAEADGTAYHTQQDQFGKLRQHVGRMRQAAIHVMAERRGIEIPDEIATTARKAYRSIRREGFAEAFADDEVGEAFEAALDPLGEIAGLVESLRAALPEDPNPEFEADRALFRAAFTELYAKETSDGV